MMGISGQHSLMKWKQGLIIFPPFVVEKIKGGFVA